MKRGGDGQEDQCVVHGNCNRLVNSNATKLSLSTHLLPKAGEQITHSQRTNKDSRARTDDCDGAIRGSHSSNAECLCLEPIVHMRNETSVQETTVTVLC